MIDIELRGVSERDVDLFLLEEVVASPPFRQWFLSQIDVPATSNLIHAARSVTTSTGESDLEFTFQLEDRVIRVLVENKVYAILQDRQPERYGERAQAYVQAGECDETRTVLVAPAAYSSAHIGFEYRVTYEEVREYLDQESNGDPRTGYKLALLEAAIHRGTSGWKLEPDEAVTRFWQEYWKRATTVTPQLRMPKPGRKPATSSFIRFDPAELPPGVSLIHKFAHGNVDLQFSGMADHIGEFYRRYSRLLENGMALAEASQSLAIRVEVPRIRAEIPIEQSEDKVGAALRAAKRLLDWFIRHGDQLDLAESRES